MMKLSSHRTAGIQLLLAIGFILIFAPLCRGQQKVQFTQYMFNGLVINPAYAGAEEALSLTFIQRNQWNKVENAPTTQTFSAHTLVKKKKLGLGLTLVNDKIGVHKNLSVLTNYAYHIQTGSSSYLSMGIQAGFHNAKSDYASLTGATNDPKIYNMNISSTFFDFGAGIYFRSAKFQAGLSAPELLPNKVSLSDSVSVQLNRTNLFLFSKYNITLTENLNFEPSVLLKYIPDLPFSFDVNVNLVYRNVINFGLSYRKNESVDFLFKAQVTPQLQFGYAYDHTIGDVARLSNASHELMVHYLFRYTQTKIVTPR
ncbi:MAG TPA: type IX secretion system membrane protein PorP/SprF [Cyclobacteriaceae bacterium]|nr:type IX secretion system membrane protein PorP/SprF [Cyclobacteriaceae bacterium]